MMLQSPHTPHMDTPLRRAIPNRHILSIPPVLVVLLRLRVAFILLHRINTTVLPPLPLKVEGVITDLPHHSPRRIMVTLRHQDQDFTRHRRSLRTVVVVRDTPRVQAQAQDPFLDLDLVPHLAECPTDNHRPPCPRSVMYQDKQHLATTACRLTPSEKP